MTENGYMRSKRPANGCCRRKTSSVEQEQKDKQAQLEWSAKLKRWSGWLSTDKAAQADRQHQGHRRSVRRRGAGQVPEQLENRPRDVRLLYVEALGRLNAAAGMDALVGASLYDADEEIRLASLDQIVANNTSRPWPSTSRPSRARTTPIVNRAADRPGPA